MVILRLSQIVGAVCMNANMTCGACKGEICPNELRFCRDMADILGACDSSTCQAAVQSMQAAVCALVVLSICTLADTCAIVLLVRVQKYMLLQISVNGISSLLKWISLATLLQAEVVGFTSIFLSNNCLSTTGQSILASGLEAVNGGVSLCAISAFCSLTTLPFTIFFERHET